MKFILTKAKCMKERKKGNNSKLTFIQNFRLTYSTSNYLLNKVQKKNLFELKVCFRIIVHERLQ